jgi:hypothetical protein
MGPRSVTQTLSVSPNLNSQSDSNSQSLHPRAKIKKRSNCFDQKMSDDDESGFAESGTTPSNDDEWIIPEPCLSNNCLHWSEEGIFAIAARETVFLVDPCKRGSEGVIGSVSLSNSRDEKALVCGYRVYEDADHSRLVEDLRARNPANVSAITWSPAGLHVLIRSLSQILVYHVLHDSYVRVESAVVGGLSTHRLCK